MNTPRIVAPRRRVVAASLLALWLAACGGGGSDGINNGGVQGPPAQAAALQQSADEASQAVQAAVDGGGVVVERAAGADSYLLPINGPTGGGRESPQAVETLGCAEFLPTPCSGTVRVDTDITGPSTVARAGQYVDMSFNALSGTVEGQDFTLAGGFRMDFLSDFDLDSTSLNGLRVDITARSLRGQSEGISFGPESGMVRVEFTSNTAFTLTGDGLRLSGLSGVTSTDADNYVIGTATLRRAYWRNDQTHVDNRYTGWNVDARHVRLNSRAAVLAGATRADIEVISTTSTQTVFEVDLDVGGVLRTYHVTATFPAGGGAPTYVVELIS